MYRKTIIFFEWQTVTKVVVLKGKTPRANGWTLTTLGIILAKKRTTPVAMTLAMAFSRALMGWPNTKVHLHLLSTVIRFVYNLVQTKPATEVSRSPTRASSALHTCTVHSVAAFQLRGRRHENQDGSPAWDFFTPPLTSDRYTGMYHTVHRLPSH